MRALVAFIFSAALLAICGCGLSDDVRFDLPAEFTVSTSDAQWRASPPEGVPTWVCDGRAALVSDCCHTPSGESFDCGHYPLRCDGDGFCALAFDYHSVQTVNLDAVASLRAFRGRTMTGAMLSEFLVVAEGAMLPIRTMDIFVGPRDAEPNEPSAVLLASFVPPADLSKVSVPLSAEARSALSSFIVDAHSPFDLTLVSRVFVTRGQVSATGLMSLSLSGKVEAHY